MKNPLTVGGGLLAVVSMFLAFTTIFGKSIKLIDNPDGDAYVWIAFGVIIAVVGLVNKRWLNILSLILGLIIAAAAFYYQKQFIEIKFVGIGIWTLLLAGLLSIAGSVNGLRKK